MKDQDLLAGMRKELLKYIENNYKSVEEFCWDKGIAKSTVSNFLNTKKDFQISTLEKISSAIKKRLVITAK